MVTNDGFLDLYFYHDRDQQLKLTSRRMAASNRARTKKTSTVSREKRELREIENEKILAILYGFKAEGLQIREHKVGAIVNLDTSRLEKPVV